ncbi:ATP-binding protein [Streptomyces sp. 549]|uniref:ATP-binding protein n=1 Tax=Streptomyces sp. 549 TaxID=3049076 RepID=UPI0024C2C827|nr:ATP-binding protein [Streptomyces sp. 549]MDK1476641.1 ATP-binding protein [Streptomyces sp. 549]
MSETGAAPRPAVTELRLSAFRGLCGTRLPLGPLTLLSGPSGSGKSTVLEAHTALARLAAGDTVHEVFDSAPGGSAACVPLTARPDGTGRRGFRLGCTVTGPAGQVHLDIAVQAEPQLRVVGERLVCGDRTLLTTALRDPGRRTVQAAWHTAGSNPVTRAPLPDDRLATALLPLRVAGTTEGQRQVLAAAEQTVLALRSVFRCDPRPERMRAAVAPGDALLRGCCDNLAAVLRRHRTGSAAAHAALLAAASAGWAGPDVRDLRAEGCEGAEGGLVRAVADRGRAGRTPLEWLADGELRYTALVLALLGGPDLLDSGPVGRVPDAGLPVLVLADGLDRGLDKRQTQALLALAGRVCAQGDLRLLGTLFDVSAARTVPGACVLRLGGARAARPDGSAAAPDGPACAEEYPAAEEAAARSGTPGG